MFGTNDVQNFAVTARQQLSGLFTRSSHLYAPLKQETSGANERPPRWTRAWSRGTATPMLRRHLMLFAALLLLSAGLLYSLFSPNDGPETDLHRHRDHMFRVFLPSSEADAEVCKTVLTAGILGYPTPEILRYNNTLDAPERQLDRERVKLLLLNDHFRRISSNSDADIAMILDTPYSWFQLRPEVLLSRYYEANHRANEMLRKFFSADEVAFGGINQEIVMSVQPAANQSLEQQSTFSEKTRVGILIGPIRKMRALLERANSKMEERVDATDVSTILSEIFDQQELHRQQLRQRYRSWTNRKWRALSSLASGQTASEGHAAPSKGLKTEDNPDVGFGLGLDYSNELGLIVTSDKNSPAVTLQTRDAPHDLATSMSPYWTPSGRHPLSQRTWSQVNLLGYEDTKTAAAVVNFPWSVTGVQRETWANYWIQPYPRDLLDEALTIPRLPVASVLDSNSIEHTFWDTSVRFDRAGVKMTDGAWAPWADICDKDSTYQPAP